MKYLIALFFISPLFLISQNAFAMVPKIDSVYADSCYQDGINSINRLDSAAFFGKPDNKFGQLTGNGPLIDISFKKYKSNQLQPIKAGSVVLIWGKKDTQVDSSAGQITFNTFDAGGSLVSSKPIILDDGMKAVTVPEGNWDFIELGLAEPIDAGSKNHAKSYSIDAVALLQDTATPSAVKEQSLLLHSIASYPNPFVSNTTIHFELQTEGEVELLVVDALGRESDRVNTGYLENGIHDIPLAIRTSGIYFVRLFLNGQPIGSPLKITSR